MADRRGDALLRAFARDLAKMRRDLRNLEAANQISSASIEGGTLDVYDDDDVLRERIGKQANGSYGRLVLEGPVPPVPSEPDVVVIADGVVAITWDGRCEEKWPFVEFEAVRVHLVSDELEACDRDNQVGAIFAARGGTIVAVTESDDDNPVYVRLVAVSSAGHVSDPSPAVLVDELDEDDLDEEDEEQLEWEANDVYTLTAADVAAGVVTMPLSREPEDESLVAFLAGWPQQPTEYTIDYAGRVLTLPLAGWEKAGWDLWVHYSTMQGPAGATFTITDDFERVSLGGATRVDTGDTIPWQTARGTWQISSGKVYCSSVEVSSGLVYTSICAIDTQQADGELSITIRGSDASNARAFAFRVSDDLLSGWTFQTDGGLVYDPNYSTSAGNSIYSTGASLVTGDLVRIRLIGETITVFVNGTQVYQLTDARNATATLSGFAAATAQDPANAFDNYTYQGV